MASRRCCSASMCCRSSSVNGGAANDSRAFLKRYSLTCSSPISCILSCSYIKPQHCLECSLSVPRCILSCSYIKPQRSLSESFRKVVVYYHVPTSNHNISIITLFLAVLYIIMFLHQTTTPR